MIFRARKGLSLLLFAVVVIVGIGVAAFRDKEKRQGADSSTSGSSMSSSMSADALYQELAGLISNPERDTTLDEEFRFQVYVADEAEEVVFEDEPDITYLYQAAYISRSDDFFFLDVKDLDNPLVPDRYYTIAGELDGFVYWTEDNEKVKVLDIIALGAEEFTPKDDSVNTGPSYTADAVQYTFQGAHYSDYLVNKKAVVVYFDFTNDSKQDAAPSLSSLDFYQGNSTRRSSSTVIPPKQMDANALNASRGFSDKTYPGKTDRYCAVFEVSEDATEDQDILYLLRYDDEFSLIDDIAIPIQKDLAAWQDS